jgi:hypothetical protein
LLKHISQMVGKFSHPHRVPLPTVWRGGSYQSFLKLA